MLSGIFQPILSKSPPWIHSQTQIRAKGSPMRPMGKVFRSRPRTLLLYVAVCLLDLMYLFVHARVNQSDFTTCRFITANSRFRLQREFHWAGHSSQHNFVNPTWPTEWRQTTPLLALAYYMETGDLSLAENNWDLLSTNTMLHCLNESLGLIDFRHVRVIYIPGHTLFLCPTSMGRLTMYACFSGSVPVKRELETSLIGPKLLEMAIFSRMLVPSSQLTRMWAAKPCRYRV
jgi:hypothetical protein